MSSGGRRRPRELSGTDAVHVGSSRKGAARRLWYRIRLMRLVASDTKLVKSSGSGRLSNAASIASCVRSSASTRSRVRRYAMRSSTGHAAWKISRLFMAHPWGNVEKRAGSGGDLAPPPPSRAHHDVGCAAGFGGAPPSGAALGGEPCAVALGAVPLTLAFCLRPIVCRASRVALVCAAASVFVASVFLFDFRGE